MTTHNSKHYDVAIVGAGIGGLVCGCYLARAGMRVLIVEKHNQVGGYCSSFFRNGYYFDSAVHSLRGLNPKNQLGIVFRDLGLTDRMKTVRIDPSDIIYHRGKEILIFNNSEHTVESFKENFSDHSKEIDLFFTYLTKTPFPRLYKENYKITFGNVLDKYFTNNELKSVFNILLGNLGLDANRIAAISALVFLNELITDGGYYPLNGIQEFPNILKQRFIEYGGEVLLSTMARRIQTKNNHVCGIFLQNGEYIKSDVVVSNADATLTYTKLLEPSKPVQKTKHKISSLELSPSALIIYLGIKGTISNTRQCCTLWHFPLSDAYNCYEKSVNSAVRNIGKYTICGLSGVSTGSRRSTYGRTGISLTTMAPWKMGRFWDKYKHAFSEKMIKLCCSALGVSQKSIETKMRATPYTLYRFTHNHNGALYGWASLPRQISNLKMPQKSNVKGMYLCGHWATRGWGQGGVSMVANSGRTTAELISKSGLPKYV